MVAAEDGNALGVSDLQGDEQCDCLNRVVSTVDVIACRSISNRLEQVETSSTDP